MDGMRNIAAGMALSMPPLPAELHDTLTVSATPLPKRERTRRQLLAAAIQVISTRGIGAATIQEIAGVAGMTPATVYNHFESRSQIIEAIALWVGQTLCQRISDSYAHIAAGAERMAIGNRRYLWLAQQSPQWALVLLDVVSASPALIRQISSDALADLRLGVKQGSFRIASEAAAMDMISGTITQAMRSVAHGLTPAGHDRAVAATVLCGLGMEIGEAREVASRPLPEFRPLDSGKAGAIADATARTTARTVGTAAKATARGRAGTPAKATRSQGGRTT